MQVLFAQEGWLEAIQCAGYTIPFTADQGFFVCEGEKETVIPCVHEGNDLVGCWEGIAVHAAFTQTGDAVRLHIRLENTTSRDLHCCVGFHMGVDTCMETYPQWHKPFFPTLLRCEKTHLWGYYMNTAGNALAVATDAPVASYGIRYNRLADGDYGHRITGTDIYFLHTGDQPPRHPQNLKVLGGGEVYENTLYLIPVAQQAQIPAALSRIAGIPVVQAEKYTYERGERLQCSAMGAISFAELTAPDGGPSDGIFSEFGLYSLRVTAKNGKQAEASFFCRPDWDFYLKNAAKEALAKPQKATTHVESFYGLFSAFLAVKHTKDEDLLKQAMVSADCFIIQWSKLSCCCNKHLIIKLYLYSNQGFIILW